MCVCMILSPCSTHAHESIRAALRTPMPTATSFPTWWKPRKRNFRHLKSRNVFSTHTLLSCMRDDGRTVLVEDDGTLGATLQDVLDFCNSELGSLHLLVRDAYTEPGVQVTGRRPTTWISATPVHEPVECVSSLERRDASTCKCKDDGDLEIMSVKISDMVCPITHEMFVDPVVAQDGFTYERSAILDWFTKCIAHTGQVTSPLTNAVLSSTLLFDNKAVRTMIVSWYAER